MLVELGLVEQRYKAVLEVLNDGASVTDVARRYEVGRQTVHKWLRRYATDGWRFWYRHSSISESTRTMHNSLPESDLPSWSAPSRLRKRWTAQSSTHCSRSTNAGSSGVAGVHLPISKSFDVSRSPSAPSATVSIWLDSIQQIPKPRVP